MGDMRSLLPILPVLLGISVGGADAKARAQDEVLTVERREDVRAHATAVSLLKNLRATFAVADGTPREICRLLATAAGEKLSFSCSGKPAVADARLSLDLKHASVWAAMAAVQAQSELRFVFRHGVVFLVPKDEVKPLTYLAVYDLRPQTARLRNFPGPRLGLVGPGEEGVLFPPEEESDQTVSGFTAETIETLLREGVTPEQWDAGGVSLSNANGLFLIRHTLHGHREIRVLLDRLGLVPLPTLRRESLDSTASDRRPRNRSRG